MPLTYFDRAGAPLTRERWQELIRDPDYSLVQRSQYGADQVSTHWLGVVSDLEAAPLLFLVEQHERHIQRVNVKSAEMVETWRSVGTDTWHASLEAALRWHRQLERALAGEAIPG